MLSTAHLLTGAAVGTVLQNPAEVILVSILLHFVWDSWPHWDPNYDEWPRKQWFLVSSADLLIGLCLAWYITGEGINDLVMLGMFFSIFPDILTMLAILGKIKFLKKYVAWHRKIQNVAKLKFGLVFQLMVVIAAVLVIKMSIF